MLSLRFSRVGRRNKAFFRIVLTEKSRPADSGFIKVLGWYNPHTKETSLQKEEILSWLNKGAQPSNTVAKLLENNKVKHKSIKFIPDAPKAKKEKKEGGEKPKPKPKSEEKSDSSKIKEEAPDKETKENQPAQDMKTSDLKQGPEQEKEAMPKPQADAENSEKNK